MTRGDGVTVGDGVSKAAPVVVRVPGDKSVTHRALVLAALADGDSLLTGLLSAADTRSTARALRDLGSDVPDPAPATVTVRGAGLRGWTAPARPIDCGNSGTTARLLLGALAGCPLEAVLTGDESLRRRPLRRVTDPLIARGARFEELGEPDRLPIRVRGTRTATPIHHVNHRSSAQVKTAMILAGLTGGSEVVVTEPKPSRDHTERILRAMGAPVASESSGEGVVIRVPPTARLEPLDLTIPGDFSSAAFFLAVGALRGAIRVEGVGLNPTRTGMLHVLERMGVRVTLEDLSEQGGEPTGSVETARRDELRGTVVAGDEVPALIDEIPILAALAATAPDETRFEGVGELRVKESDRIRALVENLRALGVDTEDGPDHLVVRGTSRPLRGEADSFGDHRIAMAFGVLATLPGNRIRVRGRGAVSISYPTFWNELERVSHEMEEQ